MKSSAVGRLRIGRHLPLCKGRTSLDDIPDRSDLVTLLRGGEVMVGRGIDRVLPHPSDPRHYEVVVVSATECVALAEKVNGPIPKPVDFRYVWGDSLAELERRNQDQRLINLEIAVTGSTEPAPKGINCRMRPENFSIITATAIDCCTLANNHTLYRSRRGLLDTLATVTGAGVKAVGAGPNLAEAATPASCPFPEGDA